MSPTARSRAVRKYNARKYDRISVMVPRGRKAEIEEFAATTEHKRVNGLINALLAQAMGFSSLDEWKRGGVDADDDV